MTQDEIMEMAKTVRSSGYWDAFDLINFAKLVAARTLMNTDPSSFMSYQEGFEAGNRLAVDGFCKQLRQLHDAYSCASDPSTLQARNKT